MPEALQSHSRVSFDSKIDPFISTLVLHAFEHIYSPKKAIPRQTRVETQTLLQSSVTFLLLSILSVLLACALTSWCLPMCHKFIMVSSDIISSCLSAVCGSPLLDYVALTSMCASTSFDSSCVSYPAAPAWIHPCFFSTWDFEH